MKAYRLQANVTQWLADLARRAAHIESRSLSSYVTHLIKKDLREKGLIDEFDRPTARMPGSAALHSDSAALPSNRTQ
jgi:hypothetical protein